MLEKLVNVNNNIINQTKDEQQKKKHLLIKKILEDKQCFFKMDIETSYALLRELNVPDESIKKVYSILIDSSNLV